MMVVLPSTPGMEQPKEPVVSSGFPAMPCPQVLPWDPLVCFVYSELQLGVTALGRSNMTEATASQNLIGNVRLPNSPMPLHSCFS